MDTQEKSELASSWDLIVVGAGPAGIACARVSAAAGLQVLLLEARDRCGGRAWSCDPFSLGAKIDMGAGWLHSACVGNPIKKLIELRGGDVESDCEQEWEPLFDVVANRLYNESDLEKLQEELESATEQFEDQDVDVNKSVFQGVVDAGLPIVENEAKATANGALRGSGKKKKKNTNAQFGSHVWRCEVASQYECCEGLSLEDLSLKYIHEDLGMPGCDSIVVGGYGSFIEGLLEGPIDANLKCKRYPCLQLGQPVKLVEWEFGGAERPSVQVTTEDGQTHPARRAVVTLPLGVLQAGCVTFSPPLPAEKIQALGQLRCAAWLKIFLKFPNRFWKTGQGWRICGLTAGEPEAIFECAYFFEPLPSQQGSTGEGVLCAVLTGRAATAAEEKNDSELSHAVVRALRCATRCRGVSDFWHCNEVPEVSAIALSRWNTDPYARGTWTSFPVGSTGGSNCGILAEPLGNGYSLGFAGEHTSLLEIGCVHGAWLTGLREAEAVLLASITEGNYSTGAEVRAAAEWMLYCREATARAKAMQEYADESSSDDSDNESD